MVTVIFPQQFTKVLAGRLEQAAEGSSLHQVLSLICATHPALQKLLFLDGELSPFVGFAKRGDDKYFTARMSPSLHLQPGDSVEVIMPMAGG